ncbi:cupin domain-containing protein [Tenacibaculum sp. C7A-26P2]|uniref:cupin domain-containing protein n=1 Tax=Tenacibaculum sp. C7A-26P2 TaxID=3447504 RepID=UPI003F83253D
MNNKKSLPRNNENSNNLIHVKSEQGEEWNVLGVKIVGKILSSQTNDEYSVIISETPPNQGPPLHVHKNEDELFYILKGNYVFNCGSEKIEAKEGDFIKLPRGIPHTFVNMDSVVGITMNTITPGGFENFFNEISKESKENKLTKNKIDSIANKYGVSFVKR